MKHQNNDPCHENVPPKVENGIRARTFMEFGAWQNQFFILPKTIFFAPEQTASAAYISAKQRIAADNSILGRLARCSSAQQRKSTHSGVSQRLAAYSCV